MALDLGELSSQITVDASSGQRTLKAFGGDLARFSDEADAAGGAAGQKFGDSFADKGKAAATAAAATVAGALVYGLHQGLEREASAGKLAAQLGLDPAEQAKLGRVAGTLYGNAFGDSIGEVNDAVAAAVTSFDNLDSNKQIRRAAVDAMNLAGVFEYDVARSAQVAGQMVSSGLAKNTRDAFNLITRGSQEVQAGLRDDLLDATDEYGHFFAALGYDGQEAFSLLVEAGEKGMYGIDKTGDAIKEFGVLVSSDMAKTRPVIQGIGLDYEEMSNAFLKGGDDARDARNKIIDGLLAIEDPAKRARLAVELFGAPVEDLGLNGLPKFLRTLRDTKGGLEDVRGAARRMGEAFNDNAKTDFVKLKRGLEKDLVEFMAKDVIPFLREDFVPAVEKIGDAFDDIPSWVWKGSVGGFLALVAAGKLASGVNTLRTLRGIGGGGGLGSGIAGKAAPVPVFVTNPGFGAPGGDPPGKGGGKGILAAGAYATAAAAVAAGGTLGVHELSKGLAPDQTKAGNWGSPQGMGAGLANAEGDLLDFSRTAEDTVDKATDHMTAAARDALAETAQAFREADIPTELKTDIALNGVPESMGQARALVKQYDLTPKEKATLFKLLGYDTLMGQIRSINTNLDYASRDRRTQLTIAYANAGYQTKGGPQEKAGGGPVTRGVPYIVGEREPELFVPNTSGRILNQRQMQQAGIGGRGAVNVAAPNVRVFIGDRELRDVIRVEVDDHDAWQEGLQ